ncbi:MAG TPA: hypothetical protein VJB16_01890, partial [archaeon]|nr:hypothetical protein [archaeon]
MREREALTDQGAAVPLPALKRRLRASLGDMEHASKLSSNHYKDFAEALRAVAEHAAFSALDLLRQLLDEGFIQRRHDLHRQVEAAADRVASALQSRQETWDPKEAARYAAVQADVQANSEREWRRKMLEQRDRAYQEELERAQHVLADSTDGVYRLRSHEHEQTHAGLLRHGHASKQQYEADERRQIARDTPKEIAEDDAWIEGLWPGIERRRASERAQRKREAAARLLERVQEASAKARYGDASQLAQRLEGATADLPAIHEAAQRLRGHIDALEHARRERLDEALGKDALAQELAHVLMTSAPLQGAVSQIEAGRGPVGWTSSWREWALARAIGIESRPTTMETV